MVEVRLCLSNCLEDATRMALGAVTALASYESNPASRKELKRDEQLARPI